MLQTIRVPMSRYSYASLNDVEDVLINWSARLTTQPIEFTVVYVSFDAMTDPAERTYLLNLPTTLTLPEEAVNRLRVAGASLLRDSPQFQALMRQMGQAH